MMHNPDTGDGPSQWVPQVTGSSVFAMCYKDGVVLAADLGAMQGRQARFKGVNRLYRVNSKCVLAFSGDWGDFQHVQIEVECRQLELFQTDPELELSPNEIHHFLSHYMYNRRSKLDPIWDTVIVAGLQPKNEVMYSEKPDEEDDASTISSQHSPPHSMARSERGKKDATDSDASKYRPFIGVVMQHGSAYAVNSLATGLGSFLANQMLETKWNEKDGQLGCDDAAEALKGALKAVYCRDCEASPHFNIAQVKEVVDSKRGGERVSHAVVSKEPKTIDTSWEISEREKSGQFH